MLQLVGVGALRRSETKEYDCFLSHNWQNRGENNNENHEKVRLINEKLKDKGRLHTWFDHDRFDHLTYSYLLAYLLTHSYFLTHPLLLTHSYFLTHSLLLTHSIILFFIRVLGDVREEMLEGIDKSKIILIFITETYQMKLKNNSDACR